MYAFCVLAALAASESSAALRDGALWEIWSAGASHAGGSSSPGPTFSCGCPSGATGVPLFSIWDSPGEDPLPPREQLCNRYCSNKHTHPNAWKQFGPEPTRAMSLGIGRLGSDGFWIKDYKGGVLSSRPPFWRTPDQSEHSGLHVRCSDGRGSQAQAQAVTPDLKNKLYTEINSTVVPLFFLSRVAKMAGFGTSTPRQLVFKPPARECKTLTNTLQGFHAPGRPDVYDSRWCTHWRTRTYTHTHTHTRIHTHTHWHTHTHTHTHTGSPARV